MAALAAIPGVVPPVDASIGVLWRADPELAPALRSGAVVDGLLVGGAQDGSRDPVIIGLDPSTGDVAWRTPVELPTTPQATPTSVSPELWISCSAVQHGESQVAACIAQQFGADVAGHPAVVGLGARPGRRRAAGGPRGRGRLGAGVRRRRPRGRAAGDRRHGPVGRRRDRRRQRRRPLDVDDAPDGRRRRPGTQRYGVPPDVRRRTSSSPSTPTPGSSPRPANPCSTSSSTRTPGSRWPARGSSSRARGRRPRTAARSCSPTGPASPSTRPPAGSRSTTAPHPTSSSRSGRPRGAPTASPVARRRPATGCGTCRGPS